MQAKIIQRCALIIGDLLALLLSLFMAKLLANYVLHGSMYTHLSNVGIAKLAGLALIVVFWYQEQYSKRRPSWEELHLLYSTIFIFAILHFGVSYFIAHHVIRIINILFWLLLLIILPGIRYSTKLLLYHFNLWWRDAYIIGIKTNALAAYDVFAYNKMLGYNIVGFVDLEDEATALVETRTGLPIFDYKQLLDHKIINDDTEIIVALSTAELVLQSEKINMLQTKYKFVSILPDTTGLPFYGVELNHFFGNDQMFLRLQNNLSRPGSRIMKRSIDIILSCVGILLLSPVFCILMLVIKYSAGGGKIFYKHQRVSSQGKYFGCLKFRTMYSNSQEILINLLANDPEAKTEWERDFKLRNDPRITPIGAWLRKTSLDEIPQLFNVLKGEMSLVGPRPIVEAEIIKYQDDFYYYQLVRPGITGLWQISGRNDLDYARRVRLDVWYVKNWSLWYDFVILIKTIATVLNQGGAY